MLNLNEKTQTKNKPTNSRIKAYKSYDEIKKAKHNNSAGVAAGAGGITKGIPNYTSMRNAIQRIADPVPFEFLKSFYGLSKRKPGDEIQATSDL